MAEVVLTSKPFKNSSNDNSTTVIDDNITTSRMYICKTEYLS